MAAANDQGAGAGPPSGMFDDEGRDLDLEIVEERVPPHDLESEAAVLSVVIVCSGAGDADRGIETVRSVGLLPEHFYGEAHRRMYEAAVALEDAGQPLDATQVIVWLRDHSRLAQVGGSAGVTEVLNSAPCAQHVAAYAANVMGKWRARRAIELGRTLVAQGDAGVAADELVSTALVDIDAIRVDPQTSSPVARRVVAVDASWLDEAPPPRAYLARDGRTGRGALEARGAYLLGAAGGVGKGFATIALAVAVVTGTPWLGCLAIERAGRVLVVSAEEPADELRRRIYYVARAARIATIPPAAIEIVDLHDLHAPLLDADGHTTANAEALVDLARRRGPFALVVLDPLARLAGAPIDKDNVAAGALISVLEAVSSAAQGLSLGVHHTSLMARRNGDVGATSIRGATGLVDSARGVLTLAVEEARHGDADLDAKLGEIVTLRLAKKNHLRQWDPIELRRGEHGELLPLDVPDLERMAEARDRANPASANRAAREGEVRARESAEDAAVIRVVTEQPGIPGRDLERRVRAIARCGEGRASVAIARVAPDRLDIVPGPRRAKLHYLRGTAPTTVPGVYPDPAAEGI